MSIEALNWAMRQRLRGCPPQCLLYVLANAADPEGVAFRWWKSADHWWPYLIKHTRLARATIFTLLRELESDGLICRELQAAPADGGRPQPVIRLNFDRLVECKAPSDRREEAAPEVAAPANPESITWTQETGRGAENTPPSPFHGLDASETIGLAPVAVHTVDSFESIPWTGEESYKENPSTPKPPSAPAEQPQASDKVEADPPPAPPTHEPIGFASFLADYPFGQMENRAKALAAFVALSEADRDKALYAAPLYARDIRTTKRKPVGAWRFLKERRFSSYQAGAGKTALGRVFVPEGGEAWDAWCAVASLAFGGGPKIPPYWAGRGPHNERGANVPAAWPLGGEGWLVPLDQWVFVARDTAQFRRWNERIQEILGRGLMLQPGRRARLDGRRLIARAGATWEQIGDVQGCLVPSEWPAAKGERRHGADPPQALSEEDADALINS